MRRGRVGRRWVWIARQLWGIICLGIGLFLGAGLLDRVVMPLVVRHGADTMVPAVVGRPSTDLDRLLQIAQLTPGRVQAVADREVPKGQIVAQDPPAGSRVRNGRAVKVLVSSGAPLRQVPDLIGNSIRHARLELAQRGLTAATVTYLESDQGREESVLATRPAAGSMPARHGRIDLLVAKKRARSLLVMPDFEGWDWHRVAGRLRRLGLRVSHWGVGERVTFQEPRPGEPISSGMRVHLE